MSRGIGDRPLYSEKVDEALGLVASAFRRQRRKSTGVPYLTHLLQVMVWVGEHGGDEEQMIAALLHDYLEDVDRFAGPELERRFGARVLRLVTALSELGPREAAWRERKTAYIERLRGAPSEVKLIAVADKLHNARSIVRDRRLEGEAVWGRFNAGKGESLWYYRSVSAALGDGFEHPLLEELRRVVAELESG